MATAIRSAGRGDEVSDKCLIKVATVMSWADPCESVLFGAGSVAGLRH